MANKNNKICIICKKEYQFCPNCSTTKPSWYMIFDGDNCHDIYEIVTSFRDGIIDKKTAYEKISKCDLKDLKHFAETTKKQIEDILSYVPVEKHEVKTENKKVEIKK